MHGARASLSAHNSAFIPSNIMAEEQAKKTYNAPNYAKITANKTCKDTKHAKLALFAQYCYSMDGRNGHDLPNIEILIQKIFSQGAGDQRAKSILSPLTNNFLGAVKAAAISAPLLLGGMTANANEAPRQQVTATPVAVTSTVPGQPASIQNPYISACDDIVTQEHKQACVDAAYGTVIILRNPTEVSNIARDIFLGTLESKHGNTIPVDVRDTNGKTTLFVFDKNVQITDEMFVNGSLVHALGVRYPQKVAALDIGL